VSRDKQDIYTSFQSCDLETMVSRSHDWKEV